MPTLDAEFKEMTISEATLTYIKDVGGPVTPQDVAQATGKNPASVRTEMTKMEKAGELWKPRHGYYELPERVETKEADVNYGAEEVSERPDSFSDKTARLQSVPVWGGDGPGTASRMMQIDSDLLRATGIDLDGATLIPIMGSSAEPYLSHGQIALATPTDRIQGEDLYVYYSWINEAHLVAWMERTDDGITFETGNRKSTYVCQEEDDLWKRDDGKTERIRIVGRVVGAMMPVGKMRAQKKELARIIMEA